MPTGIPAGESKADVDLTRFGVDVGVVDVGGEGYGWMGIDFIVLYVSIEGTEDGRVFTNKYNYK